MDEVEEGGSEGERERRREVQKSMGIEIEDQKHATGKEEDRETYKSSKISQIPNNVRYKALKWK